MIVMGDEPDTCSHQTLDLDCPVCRLFMDDPAEDWSLFEAGAKKLAPAPDTPTP